MAMKDEELAAVIVERLNVLLVGGHPFELAIGKLFSTEVPVSEEVGEHPTIQVREYESPQRFAVTPLGLLNGLVGIIADEGEYQGWGHIYADYRDDGSVIRFGLVKSRPLAEVPDLGRF